MHLTFPMNVDWLSLRFYVPPDTIITGHFRDVLPSPSADCSQNSVVGKFKTSVPRNSRCGKCCQVYATKTLSRGFVLSQNTFHLVSTSDCWWCRCRLEMLLMMVMLMMLMMMLVMAMVVAMFLCRQRAFSEQRSADEGADGCRSAVRGTGVPGQQSQPGRLRNHRSRLPDDDEVPADGLLAGRWTRVCRTTDQRRQPETKNQVVVCHTASRLQESAEKRRRWSHFT